MTEPKCLICGEDALDQRYWIPFLGRTLIFCSMDYNLLKQLFKNGQGIQNVLKTAGINIGVPRQSREGLNHEQR